MSFIFLKYIFTCNEVILNENGSVTFHEVFESITTTNFPNKLNFNLVVGIEYSVPKRGDRKVLIKITDPDDNDISGNDLTIELLPTIKNQHRVSINVINVDDLKVDKEGIYSFLVLHNRKVLTRHNFMVKGEGFSDTNNSNKSSVSI